MNESTVAAVPADLPNVSDVTVIGSVIETVVATSMSTSSASTGTTSVFQFNASDQLPVPAPPSQYIVAAALACHIINVGSTKNTKMGTKKIAIIKGKTLFKLIFFICIFGSFFMSLVFYIVPI